MTRIFVRGPAVSLFDSYSLALVALTLVGRPMADSDSSFFAFHPGP